MSDNQFRAIQPKILYFGTPVALISSLNDDASTNLAPMSSFWALGWTFVLGIVDQTQTADNLRRHPECVVNLPSPEMWARVEKLAPLTGKHPVPASKADKFRYVPDKFSAAGLAPIESTSVRPARVKECPVQMEARVLAIHELGGARVNELGGGLAAHVEILQIHVAGDLVLHERYIDPAKWSPLIYNFRHYYRLADAELGKTFRAEV